MFTGLIEATTTVGAFERHGEGARLLLAAPDLPPDLPPWEPVLGESIAISGCCLSVAELGEGGSTAYDLSAETLAKTHLGSLAEGSVVNLERSLQLGARLGGHMVSGHVDAIGRVAGIDDSGDGGRLFRFEVPEGFERWIVEKGSVTIDGISLTVVAPEGRSFAVAVIPETLRRTSLGTASVGDAVHLEADMVGKWIDHLLASRG